MLMTLENSSTSKYSEQRESGEAMNKEPMDDTAKDKDDSSVL